MTTQRIRADFTGQSIYVGIDVHKNSWTVCILTGELEHKTMNQEPSAAPLIAYLHRNFPGAEYKCVYEAGYSGFWPQRELAHLGADCIVVHPIDVPTTHKERRNRRDQVDARKLARCLRNGQLHGIYVPDEESQQDRAFVRSHGDLVKKQTRCKNQIKGLLELNHISPPEDLKRARWSNRYLDWLRSIEFEHASGRMTLELLLDELQFLKEQIAKHTAQVKRLANEEKYKQRVQLLCTVPGISVLSAMILLTEIVDIDRFKGIDELASYVGLVPGEDNTGETEKTTGLTERRNRQLRYIIIECAWVVAAKDPAMAKVFGELAARMKKSRAIIRIARKLLNRIRYVLCNREPYVVGILQ